VKLFNEEASKLLGPNHQDRMHAIQGDLNEPEKTPALTRPEWFGFDCAIISFALHHVDDPIELLKLLKARVKPGGTIVVVECLKQDGAETDSATASSGIKDGEPKYNPANMKAVPMGRVWPGFSVEDVHEDYAAAGCTDVDLRIWPEPVELPKMPTFGGRCTMYVSKAVVPLTLG